MAARVALILGGGPNVGLHTAKALQASGYRIALASRNPDATSLQAAGIHPVQLDLSDPSSIAPAFETVKQALGAGPNVVVYNGYGLTFPPDQADPLGVPLSAFENDTKANTVSLYAAAQAAVESWRQLESGPKALIYTGNILPWMVAPRLVTLGVGKAASANLIANLNAGYNAEGYRFYFAYEVAEDGGVFYSITGEGAAKVYAALAEEEEQSGWEVQFTGTGRVFKRGTGKL